jgi:hypothetical protein
VLVTELLFDVARVGLGVTCERVAVALEGDLVALPRLRVALIETRGFDLDGGIAVQMLTGGTPVYAHGGFLPASGSRGPAGPSRYVLAALYVEVRSSYSYRLRSYTLVP